MAIQIFLRRIKNANKSMTNRIKELRTKLNITQEELANSAGVRRETIVFLEQGKYNPSLNLAQAVAKALKTTIDDLFRF
jgi:putative transcriptional regulator